MRANASYAINMSRMHVKSTLPGVCHPNPLCKIMNNKIESIFSIVDYRLVDYRSHSIA